MSTFKLYQHSFRSVFLHIPTKKCYSFAQLCLYQITFMIFLLNKSTFCLSQYHPLIGYIAMTFSISAPIFKLVQFLYSSSLTSLQVSSVILSLSLVLLSILQPFLPIVSPLSQASTIYSFSTMVYL